LGFCTEYTHIDHTAKDAAQKDMEIDPPVFNHEFLAELGEKAFSRRSFMKWERIMHSHGQTLMEIFALRHGRFERCVDVVLYPMSHDQCEVSIETDLARTL
jgi:alkyldihydroxyacetonephosphate synthase